ncbi:MAG: hypothetical protein ABI599_11065 [Flavobacteriales bacterium]
MLSYTMNGKRHRVVLALLGCCLLFIVTLRCEAQNLVPNQSFEQYDTCLEVLGFYDEDEGPGGWFSSSGSPDYFQSCLPYGAANGVPMNVFSFQEAQHGANYIGLYTYLDAPEQREYAVVHLLTPLVQGEIYYASFYASTAFGGNLQYPLIWLATSKVGMTFVMNAQHWQWGDDFPAFRNYAQIYHPGILTDTLNWTLVNGSFVADSAYEYIVIGNHFDNATTDTVHLAEGWPWYARGYTLIDNVCVSSSPGVCDIATGVLGNSTQGLGFFSNPAMGEVVVAGIEENSTVLCTDVLGRIVRVAEPTVGTLRLNVATWPRGSYVLQVFHGVQHKAFKFVLVDY